MQNSFHPMLGIETPLVIWVRLMDPDPIQVVDRPSCLEDEAEC